LVVRNSAVALSFNCGWGMLLNECFMTLNSLLIGETLAEEIIYHKVCQSVALRPRFAKFLTKI